MFKEESEKLIKLAEEINLVLTELINDLSLCYQLATFDENLQFWRRNYLRTFYFLAEGASFQFKRVAIEMASLHFITGVKFSEAEKALLRGKNYSINNKGEPIISKNKIRIEDYIPFSFKMITKGCRIKNPIDINTKDWSDFKAAIQISYRLIQLKKFNEIQISDDEINLVDDVAEWFSNIVIHLGKAIESYGSEFNEKNTDRARRLGKTDFGN